MKEGLFVSNPPGSPFRTHGKILFVLFFMILLVSPVIARGARAASNANEVPSGTTPQTSAVPQAQAGSSENAGPQEAINAYFFYEELCDLCHGDIDRFTSILQKELPLAERNQYPHNIQMYNIQESMGRSRYVQITDEMGLDRDNLETPFLILGGRVFQGYDSISTNIEEAYLTAAEDLYVNHRPYNPRTKKTGDNLFDDYSVNPDHVTIVYFYRITCPDCIQVKPVVDGLPKTVITNGKELPLDIIRINTRSGNNGERIAAFFETWQVPDEDRMVPIIFFSDSYLAGVDAIKAKLQQCLSEVPKPWRLLPVKNDR